MLTGSDDNMIIAQVMGGDSQAFSRLVDRYQSYVFTLVLRFVKAREDAEEVAQDVFIKAYRGLPGFKGDSKFSTWLYTIVNTTCITFLRKKRVTVHSLDDERVLASAEQLDSGSSANGVEQKSRQAMVHHAIAMLGPDDAQILTLFYKAEQSLEEIAAILDIATNAAKVRIHRARSRLKETMIANFPEEVTDLSRS